MKKFFANSQKNVQNVQNFKIKTLLQKKLLPDIGGWITKKFYPCHWEQQKKVFHFQNRKKSDEKPLLNWLDYTQVELKKKTRVFPISQGPK